MFFRQSLILFGIVLPAAVAAAVIGAGHMVKSKMDASYANKLQHYSGYEQSRKGAQLMEKEISLQRPHVERWKQDLSEETASAVNNHLRAIAAILPAKEYQQTAVDPGGAGAFGGASAQASSQLRIAFRGTYRTMQRAFLELETRMPQLQLQELKMDPSQNQASHLNFQVTYTSWEY